MKKTVNSIVEVFALSPTGLGLDQHNEIDTTMFSFGFRSNLPLFLLSVCVQTALSSPFVTVSASFAAILGPRPKLTTLLNLSLPLFHEGGIYHPPSKSLFTITDTITDPSINNNQSIQYLVHITHLTNEKPDYRILNLTDLPNPTSGARYTHDGAALIAILAAGSLEKEGGLFLVQPHQPFNVTPLTTSFGQLPFNSPNDATVFSNGDIYFTDPVYGLENGVRTSAYLPNQVYRYSSSTKTTRTVADGFGRPNGITHSPDESTIFISDTGANVGNGTTDFQGPRSVYGYSIFEKSLGHNGPSNKYEGNVRGFSTDGLHIWDQGGELIGKVLCEGGTGNLGFAEPGVVYIMGGHVLYMLEVNREVVGTGVFRSI